MIDEQTFCACGLEMTPVAVGSPHKFCINCDRCQPTEGGKDGFRVATNRDYVFTKVWRQRILKSYPTA